MGNTFSWNPRPKVEYRHSNPNGVHNQQGETSNTEVAKQWSQYYERETSINLNSIMTKLNNNRLEIQKRNIDEEMRRLNALMMIDWQIYEQKIAISQANMVATMYTNKILGELRILKSVLEA